MSVQRTRRCVEYTIYVVKCACACQSLCVRTGLTHNGRFIVTFGVRACAQHNHTRSHIVSIFIWRVEMSVASIMSTQQVHLISMYFTRELNMRQYVIYCTCTSVLIIIVLPEALIFSDVLAKRQLSPIPSSMALCLLFACFVYLTCVSIHSRNSLLMYSCLHVFTSILHVLE